MKLVEFKNYKLTVPEEVWGLKAFKKLLDRDKTKEKVNAAREMLFIFHYCDIRSDFQHILDDKEKLKEVKKEVGLKESWKVDKEVEAAIELYKKLSVTVIEKLYADSLKSAHEASTYLSNTKLLLEERDKNGKPVTDINKIIQSIERVPKLMTNLKDAYKEVVKEKEAMEDKSKGSRKFNMFEDGF